MGIYQLLVNAYYQIIAPFPPALQWFLTLGLLVGVVVLFVHLIRSSWIWILILVVLLPVLIPIFGRLFMEFWNFILFLLVQTGLRAPAPPAP